MEPSETPKIPIKELRPPYWPMVAAARPAEQGLELDDDNLKSLAEEEKIHRELLHAPSVFGDTSRNATADS